MKKLLELFLILTLSVTVVQAQEPPVKDYYQAGKQVGYTAITVTTAGSIGRADNPLYVAGTITADTKGATITNWADAKTTTIGARIINSDGNVFSPSNALPVESGVNTLNSKVTNWADAHTSTIGARVISGTTPITTTNNGGRDALDVHASQSGIWNVDTAGTTITNWADAKKTTITSFISDTGGDYADVGQYGAQGKGLITYNNPMTSNGNAVTLFSFNTGNNWANYDASILSAINDLTGNTEPFQLSGTYWNVSPRARTVLNGGGALINVPFQWTGSQYEAMSKTNAMPVESGTNTLNVKIASADLVATTVGARVLASDGTALSPTNALPVESGANSLNTRAYLVNPSATPISTGQYSGQEHLRVYSVPGDGDDASKYADLVARYGSVGNGDFSLPVHILGSGLSDAQRFITNPNYVTWTSGTGTDITVTAVAVHGYPDTGIAVYDAFNKGFNVTITASDVILDVDTIGVTITNYADMVTATVNTRSTIYSADKATAVAVDTYGALVEIPIEHHKIHTGLSYTMARKLTNVATSGTSFHIYHPTKNMHFRWSVGFDVETYAYLWEGGTFEGAVGRTLTAKNRNRTSASLTEPNLAIVEDSLSVPVVDETKLLWMGVMGTSGVGGARGSGDVSSTDEIELKAGQAYYLYISPTNATNDGGVKFDFYSRD